VLIKHQAIIIQVSDVLKMLIEIDEVIPSLSSVSRD